MTTAIIDATTKLQTESELAIVVELELSVHHEQRKHMNTRAHVRILRVTTTLDSRRLGVVLERQELWDAPLQALVLYPIENQPQNKLSNMLTATNRVQMLLSAFWGGNCMLHSCFHVSSYLSHFPPPMMHRDTTMHGSAKLAHMNHIAIITSSISCWARYDDPIPCRRSARVGINGWTS